MATPERSSPGIGAPTFRHLPRVREAFDHIYGIFQVEDPELRRGLFAGLLIRNSIILLSGTYGTGKTLFVHLVRKLFFDKGEDDCLFDYETCHQELTAFDVLWSLDLAALQQGKEVVHPKAMVRARLKFLNEIQRANTGLINTLLPLLSERRLTYRDFVWEVPDYLCIMDRNPADSGSSAVPEAFLDRVEFSYDIPGIFLEKALRVLNLRRKDAGYDWDSLENLAAPALAFEELQEVWADIPRVDIPPRMALLGSMMTDYVRLCLAGDRSNAGLEFDVPCAECSHRGEACSHLLKVPGQRISNSLFRLAQSLAWLDGKAAVEERHLMSALPWCFAHRLALRPEELRKKMSEQTWTREVLVADMIKPKLPFWAQALDAYERGDQEKLSSLGQNDLVVGELQLMAFEKSLPEGKKG